MTTAEITQAADRLLDENISVEEEYLLRASLAAAQRHPYRPERVTVHPVTENLPVEGDEEGVVVSDPGGRVYNFSPPRWCSVKTREEYGSRLTGVVKHLPNEKAIAEAEAYEAAEVKRLRWPVVSFEPGDGERGFHADPTNRKSEESVEREYAKPYVRTVTDYVRDNSGYILLNEDGSRQEASADVLTMGSVEWEYRRRAQGRDVWMSKHAYKHVQEGKRRDDLRAYRQTVEHKLIVALGADPATPEVTSWVESVGFRRDSRSCTVAPPARG